MVVVEVKVQVVVALEGEARVGLKKSRRKS